jgi:histidine triad (HIT) family protein
MLGRGARRLDAAPRLDPRLRGDDGLASFTIEVAGAAAGSAARRAWKGRAMQDPDCIFCRIVKGEIPSRKVYEDDGILVFRDIRPQAPVHLLMIPKAHVATMYDLTDGDAPVMGRMMRLAGKLALDEGARDGFRLIVNNGRVGLQEVQHIHLHVLGGPEPLGPMLPRRSTQGD